MRRPRDRLNRRGVIGISKQRMRGIGGPDVQLVIVPPGSELAVVVAPLQAADFGLESVIASVADPPPPHAATAGSGGGGSFTLGSLSIPKLGRLSGGPGRVTPRVSSSAFHGEPTPPRRAESSRPPPAFVLIGRGKTRVSYKYD